MRIVISVIVIILVLFTLIIFRTQDQSLDSNEEVNDVLEGLESERTEPEAEFELPTSTEPEELEIIDEEIGEGPAVEVGDEVAVHYRGWLEDGTEFDNSYDRGQPFVFTIGAGQVIEGWEQGLIGMQAGGSRQLIIPSDLAYGSVPRGPIPANSTLIFHIELEEIR